MSKKRQRFNRRDDAGGAPWLLTTPIWSRCLLRDLIRPLLFAAQSHCIYSFITACLTAPTLLASTFASAMCLALDLRHTPPQHHELDLAHGHRSLQRHDPRLHRSHTRRVLGPASARSSTSTCDCRSSIRSEASFITMAIATTISSCILPIFLLGKYNGTSTSKRYHNGGSRGNPGPGGAGACVVRVDFAATDYRVIWSAAMSHAHRATTTNQAEYCGLIAGLRAARQHRWPVLEVVGDSALILNQLRDHRAPKNTRLLRLYGQARRLADQVAVRRWTHHVRAHNKMADFLSNLAMDQASSSQVFHPTARFGYEVVPEFLMNDLRPWLAASLGRRIDSSFAF